DALAVALGKRERSAARIDEHSKLARPSLPTNARAVHRDLDVGAHSYKAERSGNHSGHASAGRANDPDLRRPARDHRDDHRDALGGSLVGFAEDRRDRARLEAIDQNEKALPRLWERRRAAGDEDGRS